MHAACSMNGGSAHGQHVWHRAGSTCGVLAALWAAHLNPWVSERKSERMKMCKVVSRVRSETVHLCAGGCAGASQSLKMSCRALGSPVLLL